MKISVIVPAFNEEKLLPGTLASILASLDHLPADTELLVVDNASTDRTVELATAAGARVIHETVRNIGKVRNAGAASASGEILIFIDADTRVPAGLFAKIADVMRDEKCLGGSVAVDYGRFERGWIRFYSKGWEFWGKVFNMKQGAAQFCRRSAFEEVGGYDEKIFLGEDVEFYWRLAALAKRKGGFLRFVEQPRVVTSTRRFDKMSLWKTILLTNPIYIAFNARRRSAWRDWYENAVR